LFEHDTVVIVDSYYNILRFNDYKIFMFIFTYTYSMSADVSDYIVYVWSCVKN